MYKYSSLEQGVHTTATYNYSANFGPRLYNSIIEKYPQLATASINQVKFKIKSIIHYDLSLHNDPYLPGYISPRSYPTHDIKLVLIVTHILYK